MKREDLLRAICEIALLGCKIKAFREKIAEMSKELKGRTAEMYKMIRTARSMSKEFDLWDSILGNIETAELEKKGWNVG